jgi:hypothetical protein
MFSKHILVLGVFCAFPYLIFSAHEKHKIQKGQVISLDMNAFVKNWSGIQIQISLQGLIFLQYHGG